MDKTISKLPGTPAGRERVRRVCSLSNPWIVCQPIYIGEFGRTIDRVFSEHRTRREARNARATRQCQAELGAAYAQHLDRGAK